MPRRLFLFGVVLLTGFPAVVRAEPPLLKIEAKSPALSVAISHDGTTLATGGQDGVIRLYQIPTGKEIRTFETGAAAVTGIAFSADGKWLVIRPAGKTLSTWDVATGKLGRSGGFANYTVDQLAFSADGSTVMASCNGELVRWTVNGGASGSKQGNPPAGGFAAVAADGSVAGWGNPNGLIRLQESQPIKTLTLQVGAAHSMALAPGGKILAVGGADKGVHLWNIEAKKQIGSLTGLQTAAGLLAFSRDGQTLASVAVDSSVLRVWDVNRNRVRRQVTNLRGAVTRIALTPDGKLLASLGADGNVLLWSVATRELPASRTPVKLDAKEMEALWLELASKDFDRADAAWQKLACAGDLTVPFLKERIQPIAAPAVDQDRIARLVADLDAAKFAVRDKAAKELLTAGEMAIVPLQKTLEKPPSEEARYRAELLLKKIKEPVLTPDRLRVLEAIELLEQLRTAEACKLLESIAAEALIVQIRQEALAALQRMSRATEEK
jgi:hypothetical protein